MNLPLFYVSHVISMFVKSVRGYIKENDYVSHVLSLLMIIRGIIMILIFMVTIITMVGEDMIGAIVLLDQAVQGLPRMLVVVGETRQI